MSLQLYGTDPDMQIDRNSPKSERLLSVQQVDEYNRRAYDLRSTDLEQAIRVCETAHQSAQRLQYTTGIAWSLLNKGIFQTYASKNDDAFGLFLEAHTLFTVAGEQRGIAVALRWMGVMYTRAGGNLVALEHFLKSHDIGVRIGDTEHTSACLVNIGAAHSALGDHAKALECFSQALRMQGDRAAPLARATLLWNTGRAYEGLGHLPKALECFETSMQIRAETGDRTGTAASSFALGDVWLQMDRPDLALRRYLSSLRTCVEADFLWGEALCNRAIGALYTLRGKADRGLPYLEEAVRQAERVGNMETRLQAHHSLAECFRALGRSDTAYEHILHYHRLKEEFDSGHMQRTVTYLRLGHEAEQAQRETEIFRRKNDELAEAYDRLNDAFEEVKTLNDMLSATNARLTELNDEKNELLGIVAHDLKNPLSSIVLSASLLQRHFATVLPDTAIREIDSISRTAGRMNTLIIRLLDLNEAESGKPNLTIQPCDAGLIVANAEREYRERAREKDIIIRMDAAAGLMVMADAAALAGIVDNLLSNAIKFSPLGKSVWLRLYTIPATNEGGHARVRLEVRDEGPGITEEDQKKLFGRFARLAARPTGGEQSTGLGLSIVKKLVEAMYGTVECKSKAGAGATFIVELPAPA